MPEDKNFRSNQNVINSQSKSTSSYRMCLCSFTVQSTKNCNLRCAFIYRKTLETTNKAKIKNKKLDSCSLTIYSSLADFKPLLMALEVMCDFYTLPPAEC